MTSYVWQLDHQFGYQDPNQLLGATSVAVGSKYIAVAENATCRIHMYSGVKDHPSLRFLRSIPTHYRPLDVAVTFDGRCLVTNESPALSVYDSKGKLCPNFASSGQTNLSSGNSVNEEVLSVTQDHTGGVLVGKRVPSGFRNTVPLMQNKIFVYSSDGNLIKSINIDIAPWYLASAPHDRVIVSPDCNDNVRIYDINKGTLLRMLKPPDNISSSSWCPSGVCCSQKGEIFVANREGDIGIYRYSTSGDYLGCITKSEHVPTVAVMIPRGMAMCKDDKTLLVADWASIKVFSFRRRGSRKVGDLNPGTLI